MKIKSLLNRIICEIFPWLSRNTINLVHKPIMSVLMDSLIHMFSSKRCPVTMQAQSRVTNSVIATIEE
jgi:hypothetical protein